MASVLHWKKKASRLDLIIFKKIPGSIWFRLSIKELGGAMVFPASYYITRGLPARY